MATAAQRRIKSVSYAKYGYIFILPFFVIYFIFMIYPLVDTFVLSFKGNTLGPGSVARHESLNDWVGWSNYKNILFKDGTNTEYFFESLKNTIIIWSGNFLPQISLSLLLAVWFTDLRVKMPGKGFFKVVMYLPNIITAASVAGLFYMLFGGEYSVFASLFHPKNSAEWLGMGDVWRARLLVMFIQIWMWFGNTMIMLMSGIQGINESLFEAAEIDGANATQTFWRITFPLLKTIMVYTLLTSMIGGLQMFDIPYMLNSGDGVIPSIKTVACFIYEKFQGGDVEKCYGYAGAASVILFFITAVLGALVFYVQRDKDAIEKNRKRREAMKEAKRRAKGGGFSI
ncbi:MAG: sugar ABC transporter permease [Oscillospiraceae bacterium]|nr:sugar ABC transporter permease [Oscillospiraceae bacterium]